MSQNTSNQTSGNPGVHTGGATSFGNANFTGGGHAFGSNSTVNNYHQGPDANELKKHQLITTLPHAQAGRKVYEYKKQSGSCFPGTRQALLKKMEDWAIDPNEFGMYVLSGLAGIGKSTVAYTIAAWADERHQLGAEFFFARDEADRRSAKLFFTTIIYDLYHFNEQFKRAIGEALVTKDGSTAITGSPQEQLNALILDPLKQIRNDLPPMLIVVDALDECDEGDARIVLRGLRQLVQVLPSFKVILTTRPEALSNDNPSTQEGRKVLRLHDIDADIVNEDIRIYLKYSLSAEQVNAQLPYLTKPWCASDAQVERLIQASGKLFIMASTAVRYILDIIWSAPNIRIKQLLDGFAQGRTPFKNLVDFYTIILRSAVPANCDEASLVERYQAIVGTIVLAQEPLSVHSIASLLDIDVDQILVVLRQLQSVISVADNIPRAFHKSFVDYITDPKRCEDINLRIDLTKHHTWIARRCFEVMGKHLKFNILELGIPARFMNNEEGLAKDRISDEQLQEKIPPVLRYACVYWHDHLNNANIDDADLVKGLEKFDSARMLLPWFEVLSLIKKLDSAHRALRVALKLLKLAPLDLRQLLFDGQRFISKFYRVIEQSALHTYYSALPFTPTDSLLYRRYIDGALHRGCNVIGMPNRWDAVIANLIHESQVASIQFSLDSTMFVSWNCESQLDNCKATLKVCDAVTGTPISMIKGDWSFAIANDFSTVASYDNNAITLYNVDGSEQGVTLTASAEVFTVAISSEYLSLIAAASSDGTVSIWDSRDGKQIGSFGDYKHQSHSLEFSATGARLAYSSDKGVKLYDVIKREFIANRDWESGDFAFSRDGSRIVTCQSYVTKLWDCENGQPVGTAQKTGFTAISDNGSLLAISSNSGHTGVWGENRGSLSHIVDLDLTGLVSSLAFSTNDTLAIGMYRNVKLYSVKNRSFIFTYSISSCEKLAFSPDCTRFAVGTTVGAVFLSDIQLIESSSPSSSQQQSRELTVLALSWNCSRVACGFRDGAVEMWEIDDFPNRRINHGHHSQAVCTLGFSPDGRKFASGAEDGTINLWDGKDGAQRAYLRYSPARNEGWLLSVKVEVSNGVLAAAGSHGISLWDWKTLGRICHFDGDFAPILLFSADGALLAAAVRGMPCSITVFNVPSHTAMATFETLYGFGSVMMTFLPDNSQLLVWSVVGNSFDFDVKFDLVSKKVIQSSSENFSQLPDMPLWCGVPIWMKDVRDEFYLEALFSQPGVPVLWIPRELNIVAYVQRRSMIVLGCRDGRVVFVRLPTGTSTAARADDDGNMSYSRPAQ